MPRIDRRALLGAGALLPLAATPSPSAGGRLDPDINLRLRSTVHDGSEHWTLAERMAHHRVPGVALGILKSGRLIEAAGFGTRISGQVAPIGSNTLFSVGSVSKVATAALCLKLVSLGSLDLDVDVNRWLRRWSVPAGVPGDDAPVSLRMLLSHTGGFNVHGFEDYAPNAPLPSLVQTLDGLPPALNKPLARVDHAGVRSRYSGGGYMIVQALIEDATGQSFNAVAQQVLFGPLNMQRSRFIASPDRTTPDIAHAHDGEGQPAVQPSGWQSFPELAASGFWTTVEDLSRLILALTESYDRPDGFLPQALAADMMTTVAPGFNGLGPRLAGEGQARIFHHAGSNDSYKAYVEGNLATGDGLVVLTNGSYGDLLCDEIRNAVSDASRWPGDWSVKLASTPVGPGLPSCVGRYRRRDAQDPVISGFLDTGFRAEELEITLVDGKLQVVAAGRQRGLVPVDTLTFVMPDGYVPAATLMFKFDRGADRGVKHIRLVAGDDVLIFDRL